MASQTGRKALEGPALPRPKFSAYHQPGGTPEEQLEQAMDLVRQIGGVGITMVDLWCQPLDDQGGPEGAVRAIAARMLQELEGENSVRVARLVAELAAPMIQRRPSFWGTPLGALLIHAGALDFSRNYTRPEVARILGVTREAVRLMTVKGVLKTWAKSSLITGASLRVVWLERQARYQRWRLEDAPAVGQLQGLADELL